MSLLDLIKSPHDLKKLGESKLTRLAGEIREFLIEHVSRAGGHLGSNLGVIELTIAVHRVFDSPQDLVLFDTGHQAYVHKMLTGRAGDFVSLRREGGLSGYPSTAESPHDVIENSHASTAMSYADGLAKAFRLGRSNRRVAVVVGDGALTGGMAWEALNSLGESDHPVVVLLNDNGRSYGPTAGGLAGHLAGLRDGERPSVFEQVGLQYVGPVDGHNIQELETAIREAVSLNSPVVVHCLTRKGNGHLPAEADEVDNMHLVAQPEAGRGLEWTEVFADEIAAIGADEPNVVCVTAAMLDQIGLSRFAAKFPDRVFDVGIAEQHAVTCAAGMAMAGLHPVVVVVSTFLNRAFDQLLLDVALHRLPVTFVLDHAGVTGEEGASHHGMWDASLLPIVPGLRLAAPRDADRLRAALRTAVSISDSPTAIRYPKACVEPTIRAIRRVSGCDVLWDQRDPDCLIVAVGPMANAAKQAAGALAELGVRTTVVDPLWIAPLNSDLVALAESYDRVVVVEDAMGIGSLGGRLAQALSHMGSRTRVCTLALPPCFLPHGTRSRTLDAHSLNTSGIVDTVLGATGR
ncbi:1-deoxy-D-xylulose-5-phosphate synthase [Actinokineospora sp. HUAS TT18]|uniref:1-deoxy-D-xylulose-5-phosphate synthase n=1 Tax=Actinokineospora sp. HUAS TT18 TaxID=3447451 RepID=UPI003F51D647